MSLSERLRVQRGTVYAKKILGMEGGAAAEFAWLQPDDQLRVEKAVNRLNGVDRRRNQCIFSMKEHLARTVHGVAGDPICGCYRCKPMEP